MSSISELASYFHAQVLRIPHEGTNPTKRFLTEDQILKLFTGTVSIQEKVDGKLCFREAFDYEFSGKGKLAFMWEDFNAKKSVHTHIKSYNRPPVNLRVYLDAVLEVEGYTPFIIPHTDKDLTIATIKFNEPNIDDIYTILEKLANRKSIYGDTKIEGLVIKNFGVINNVSIQEIIRTPHLFPSRPLFGKYINTEFEDALHERV
jgi:hypothetical protein